MINTKKNSVPSGAKWAARPVGDTHIASVRVSVDYTLHQAAAALAAALPNWYAHLSHRSLRHGLQEAARRGYTGNDTTTGNPETVERYAHALVEQGIFPHAELDKLVHQGIVSAPDTDTDQ